MAKIIFAISTKHLSKYLKQKKQITLNTASKISCKIKQEILTKSSAGYRLYLDIDNYAPFIYYVEYHPFKDYLEDKCIKHQDWFAQYISNYNKYTFSIKTSACLGDLLLCIYLIIIICLVYLASIKTNPDSKENDNTAQN